MGKPFSTGTPSDRYRNLVTQSRDLFPGGTTNSVSPAVGEELIIDGGEGPYLIDVDGRQFLDFSMGAGPLLLGHAHPRMVKTMQQASAVGSHHFAMHHRAIKLAERITKIVPCAEMVRFASSGSEATFHALRLARAATGRQAIIKFDGAYHGHHDLAVWSFEGTATQSPTPTPESAGIQAGVAENIDVLPFNDSDAVRKLLGEHPERYAAIICEPFQRMISPDIEFLETLRTECDRTNTVLIFDEIVTGFRLAPGGAQEKYGVVPDLTSLGKALAGGLPMSAIVGKKIYMSFFDPTLGATKRSFHCGTLNGYYLAVESAHTMLDILVEEGGIERLQELGDLTRDALSRVIKDAGHVFSMAGEGPLFHPYFIEKPIRKNADIRHCDSVLAQRFNAKLFEAGIYKSASKGYLGLAHEEEHIDALADAAAWAFDNI